MFERLPSEQTAVGEVLTETSLMSLQKATA